MFLWIFLALLVLAVGYVILIFNGLVSLRNQSAAAWSDIDVQLKRRHNLIPNLVEVVKGYATHERQTFEKVIAARQRGLSAGSVAEKGQAETALSGAIHGLIAIAENYPQLKANENFLDLARQLSEIEEAVQNSRRYYNAVVRDLNTKIESFPDLLIARSFGFSVREFFQLDGAAERAAPKVSF